MATVRELITKWGFNVDDKPLKNLEKNLNKVKTTVKVVGGIAIGAAGSIFGLAQSFAVTGDNVAKTADKLGIGIEALQELRFAADLAGVSTGNFDNSIRFLARNMGDAANGIGEAKDAFKKLGISITDVSTGQLRKVEDVFADVSEAFKNLGKDPKKVALAMDIFGKSGTDMINLMNQGKFAILAQRQEARDLGIVLSEIAARDSEKLIDAQTRLKAVFSGIRNIIGEDLLPTITEYTDSFRRFVVANREFIKTKIDAFLGGMLKIIKGMVIPFNVIVKAFSRFIDLLGGAEIASKRLLTILGAIAFVQIAGVIGNIAISLFQLARGFKLAGNAAIFAQAKALVFPILIGASIVALGLLFEDFFVFLKGGESVFENLANSFGFDVDRIRQRSKDMIQDVKSLISGIGKVAKDSLGFLVTFSVSVSGAVTERFNKLLPSIEKSVKALTVSMGKLFDALLEQSKDIIDSMSPVFDSFFKDLKALIKSEQPAIQQTFKDIADSATTLFNTLLDTVTNIFSAITNVIKGDLNSALDNVAKIFEDMFNIISKIFGKISRVISGSFNNLVKQYTGFTGKITQSLASFLGIDKDVNVNRTETIGQAIANNSIGSPSPPNAPIKPPSFITAGASQSFNINAPINIKVPEGTPIERIAPQISTEIKDTFDEIIRSTARSNKPAVVF